ncbi:hypothetical protein HPULCUR_003679 [Helicostylum pulchrum]|uniref:Uncharacterized protein n=1 Tax=Helicostylum pulchrum TaxID=562976 RepID=A0ABP9XU35_9FUNG
MTVETYVKSLEFWTIRSLSKSYEGWDLSFCSKTFNNKLQTDISGFLTSNGINHCVVSLLYST